MTNLFNESLDANPGAFDEYSDRHRTETSPIVIRSVLEGIQRGKSSLNRGGTADRLLRLISASHYCRPVV